MKGPRKEFQILYPPYIQFSKNFSLTPNSPQR